MSIFSFIRKDPNKKVQAEIQPISNEIRYKAFDKIDYQFESALQAYCSDMGKDQSELTDDDINEIYRYAGTHIGFFMTWIIQNHFEGEIHKESGEALEQVRKGSLLGVDFVIQYCDTKFWGEDVCDQIFDFVNSYYDQYLMDYSEWVMDVLCDIPLEFLATYEDYKNFKYVIDTAYKRYLKNR